MSDPTSGDGPPSSSSSGAPRVPRSAAPTPAGPWARAAARPAPSAPPDPNPRRAAPAWSAPDPTAPSGKMTLRGAPITVALILAMSAIEAAAAATPAWRFALIEAFAFRPISAIGVWYGALPPLDLAPLLTHAALHGGLLHLLFNMLAMLVLSPPSERACGPIGFVALTLVTAIGGALGHLGWELGAYLLAAEPDATMLGAPLVGASGVISGYLGFDLARRAIGLARLPHGLRRVSPGRWLLGASTGFVLINALIMALGVLAGGGFISGAAHLGGFFVGLALAPLLVRRDAPFHP